MRHRFLFVVILCFMGVTPVWARFSDDPNVKQWAYNDTEVYDAWDFATGSRDVVVAVIDNGFDIYHPDIANNVWKNVREIQDNGIDDDKNGFIDDVWGWNFVSQDKNHNGAIDESEIIGDNDPRPQVVGDGGTLDNEESLHHGTLVAGIIGAEGDNHLAGAGINWHVRLMNVKVVDNTGIGDIQNLDKAIRYAVDNGADIINISLVSDEKPGLRDAVKYAYDHGVAVIAAAGNENVFLGGFPRYPACIDADEGAQWVLGVSAVDESHHITRFSNYGSSCVDITAPGVRVSSTMRYAPLFGLTELYRGRWNGTSFSAPIVSGAAALLKSIHPEWKAPQLYDALLKSVHKTPPTDQVEYAHLFGAGLVRVGSAVRYALALVQAAHPLSSVLAFDLNLRIGVVAPSSTIMAPTLVTAGIGAVDDVAAFQHEGLMRYATVRWQNTKKKNIITIYDSAWQKQREWSVSARGPMSLVAGNILDTNEPNIVLAPRYADKTLYSVYSSLGNLLDAVQTSNTHSDVRLGLVDNRRTNKQEVLALYSDRGVVALHHFDSQHAVVRTIPISGMKKVGGVAGGYLLGDGREQYVVAAGAGEEPWLSIFGADGDLVRKFYAFDPSYRSGMSLVIGDYDGDGKDDMIVVPSDGKNMAKVWSARAQLLDTWALPPSFANHNVIALPEYAAK